MWWFVAVLGYGGALGIVLGCSAKWHVEVLGWIIWWYWACNELKCMWLWWWTENCVGMFSRSGMLRCSVGPVMLGCDSMLRGSIRLCGGLLSQVIEMFNKVAC